MVHSLMSTMLAKHVTLIHSNFGYQKVNTPNFLYSHPNAACDAQESIFSRLFKPQPTHPQSQTRIRFNFVTWCYCWPGFSSITVFREKWITYSANGLRFQLLSELDRSCTFAYAPGYRDSFWTILKC